VTLQDWAVFLNLLSKPDAEYEIAFRLFADPATGYVDFNSFKENYARNKVRLMESKFGDNVRSLTCADIRHHPVQLGQRLGHIIPGR
jgi:hypothetical protein